MNRRSSLVLLAVTVQIVLAACEPKVRNCPVIEKDPASNYYNLEYELIIPSDCPVPLAHPGTEKKYAAARILDLGTPDLYYSSVKVKNSRGEEVADDITLFLSQIAEPSAEYVAATGTNSVNDYDTGIFAGWSQNGSKRASGEVKIEYVQSTLSATLAGTRIPSPNTTHTWYAPANGGVPGYVYQWYRDGVAVGNGASYTGDAGTTDFNLRVEVTDQTWSTATAVLAADVGGVAVSVAGPGVVYSSQGGGSWTASGAGGTGPYTFAWYLDGNQVGTGPTWAGYPGENGHTLQVQMRDGAGAFDSHSIFVRGIGSGNGTCEPVPPALTCE